MSQQSRFALLRRPLAVWLAVLIALFAALVPTLSHALALSRAGELPLHVLCTSNGVQSVALISTDSADGQKSAPTLEHCPFCLLSTDPATPAPCLNPAFFQVQGGHQVPTVRQAFFFLALFVLTPPPRGPPFFS